MRHRTASAKTGNGWIDEDGKVTVIVDRKKHRLEPGSGVTIVGRKYLVGKHGQLLRLDKHVRRSVD